MKTYNHIFKDKQKLIEFLGGLEKKENLIQIFSGVLDKKKIKEVINTINKYYPNAKIIGATTDGEIVDGKVKEGEIIISVSLFDKAKVKTLLLRRNEPCFEFGQHFAKRLIGKDSKVLIVFSDSMYMNGEDFIEGIGSVSDIIIAGGMAGDRGELRRSYVFDNSSIVEKGAVGAVIEGDIYVYQDFSFNWVGVGKKMRITKSIKNRVYEIDNTKAKRVYEHYFGEYDVVKVGVQFPLVFKKDNFQLARAVIRQNRDGSLIFGGNLEEDEIVQFGFADVSSILEKDKQLLKKFQNYYIESIFIYSCMARRRFLGDYIKSEIAPFAFVPVSGFFTYGEFFKDKRLLFLNETMTFLILSENEVKPNIKVDFSLKEEFNIIKPLTHLIKVTSQELNELNEELEKKVIQKTKEIIEKNKKLEYLIYFDTLTNLPNRYSFEKDIMEYEISGVLLLDIKGFSKINDLYGEEIGDLLLKSVARKLERFLFDSLKLYRLGADQFIFVAFEGVNFLSLWKRIVKSFSLPIEVKNNKATFSFDIAFRGAVVNGNYKDIKQKADLALNYAKKKNLDFIEYSKSLGLEEKIKQELEILKLVKDAIKEDRVFPVFQKIEKKKPSYEALVRIRDKDGNLISPYYFLPAIKPTSYYFEITKIMIEKSFKIFSLRDEDVSINFSFKDIANPKIVRFFIKKINEYNMQNRVIVEILESESIEDFELIFSFVNKVRKYGVKIAIDDFGSGYSNFLYIAKIMPDFIKIDGEIIKNILKRPAYLIAKHITKMAKDFGCEVIAEFVSSKEIYEKLKEIGVDGFQGYYIDMPKELS
jgi:diguanylate cyclase (GGDEF)-like protein